jgi:hypothetical protein
MRRKRNRSRKAGGIMDSLNTWTSSISTGASDLWNKTKESTTGATSYLTGSTPTTTTTSSYTPSYTQGGRRRKSRRRMRGGNLAMNAAPVSGMQTAAPQVWVGGRRTRRRRRTSRRRRR